MASKLAEQLKDAGIPIREDDFMALVRGSMERVVGNANAAGESDLPPEERKRLERGGFTFEHTQLLPNDDPVLKGAAEFELLVASALTVSQAARALRVNPARIRQRLLGPPRTLYGIKRDGEWKLPSFQFDRRAVIPGMGDVIAALDPHLHPVTVLRWLRNPNPDLVIDGDRPLSPLDWLRTGGDPSEVSALAADL